MESQGDSLMNFADRVSQLEAENKALKEEIRQLRSSRQAATEKEYQESQLRFQTIFEQSTLGNKIIASDLRIMRVNKALVAMLGYTKAEIEGSRISEYAHPDYVDHWRELQENLWTKQIPSFQLETVLVKKNGATLCCAVTSILFKEAGDTFGYTILEDISERKAVEAKLKKVYDAQETIVHTVAHDLKNPIHNITMLAGILKKNLEKLQTVHSQQENLTYVTLIATACDKAYGIIQDLLLIGELELNQLLSANKATDLKSFVESEVAQFQVTAQKKGIAIHLHLPVGQVHVLLNPEKFARVVENLLSNAIKFTQLGGQVIVSLHPEAQKVILQVQDNGIGIPQSLQESIFNKFTKANRPGTQGEATTGLGLFIVKQIVEFHKGRIWLESTENKGTTFYVELPKI